MFGVVLCTPLQPLSMVRLVHAFSAAANSNEQGNKSKTNQNNNNNNKGKQHRCSLILLNAMLYFLPHKERVGIVSRIVLCSLPYLRELFKLHL